MRKAIVMALTAAMLVPAVANAQSAAEVRHDRREVARDRAEIRQDQRRGDWREARRDSRELARDRRELHEDWRDHRRAYPDRFRRPGYAAPRGYAYRPIGVGGRLESSFYGRSYWINDWSSYRLSRPGPGLQWIRYGNDVLLVNVRNGHVLRVYSRFFY